ncbi:Cof-type HAD-IIB family hydrolase [Bacillus mangrovi]|uniref:Cof-type HAD-IIB family hydrolase n=1 Tax=Metabacillus mangrovi TaxID=1491830 RepID=A0A7X2V5U9_9BACI|nr:HAD family hydrolase [Metabacillus mangrovi]MTH54571.1 Cof-type HAD-IIB family hydrolase [Metabacillus mangrovi]
MTHYQSLFLDIDGTIVTPEDTIEDSTVSAVSAVQEQGILAVLATGRPIHEISHIAEKLSIQSFIGYNGAYGIHEEQDVFKFPMSRESVKYFIVTAQEKNHEIILYTHEYNLYTSPESERTKMFKKKLHLTKNKKMEAGDLDSILGMTVITDSPEGSVHYQAEGIHLPQVNVDGLRHCFDVIREDVNKGAGLRQFLKHLGLPAETAIAFGDGMNDKEMLASAGEGFAMGNAHPDLFPYAKHRTADVSSSGIYKGLQSLGLVK